MALETDLNGVRWIPGAWFGAQLGGTAWMLTAFVAYAMDAPRLGAVFLVGFVVINALGIWLWRNRTRFRFFRSLQLMTLVCSGLALGSVFALDRQGIQGSRSDFRSAYLFLFVMTTILLLQFEVFGRMARRRGEVLQLDKPVL